MTQLLLQGGPIIFLLLACSVTGLYIVVQKVLFFKYHFFQFNKTIQIVKDRLLSFGTKETLLYFRSDRTIPVHILMASIKLHNRNRDEIQDGIRESLYNQIPKLEFMMPILSSIITVAPILGLTGTVLGLMDIFNVISGGSIGDSQALSAGIAKALVTTVVGLLVSLPFIFFYQYFSQKIEHSLLELERISYEIIHFCESNEAIKH
tara:strand:+ start:42 stop:659 length:618 start_codon:yes stop_codon:yes gene_type:complete